LSVLQDLLDKGARASASIGQAREAYREFNDAVGKVGSTLSDKDKASLQERYAAVHAESMAMSGELEDAANARLAQLG
jgi:hypothetical protein